jgi:hypothetical protein
MQLAFHHGLLGVISPVARALHSWRCVSFVSRRRKKHAIAVDRCHIKREFERVMVALAPVGRDIRKRNSS